MFNYDESKETRETKNIKLLPIRFIVIGCHFVNLLVWGICFGSILADVIRIGKLGSDIVLFYNFNI